MHPPDEILLLGAFLSPRLSSSPCSRLNSHARPRPGLRSNVSPRQPPRVCGCSSTQQHRRSPFHHDDRRGAVLLIGGKLVIGGLRLFSFAVVVATHTHTHRVDRATPINAQLGSYYLPINRDTSVHSLTLATLLARFTWPTLKYAPRSSADGFARFTRVNYRATMNRSLVNRQQPGRRFKRGGLFDRPLLYKHSETNFGNFR